MHLNTNQKQNPTYVNYVRKLWTNGQYCWKMTSLQSHQEQKHIYYIYQSLKLFSLPALLSDIIFPMLCKSWRHGWNSIIYGDNQAQSNTRIHTHPKYL